MRSHLLKIVDPHYGDVKAGRKTFEFRKNDRDYRVGDILVLRHWVRDPECQGAYIYVPGEMLYREVSHILTGVQMVLLGIGARDYCVMSLQYIEAPLPVLAFCPRCQAQHVDKDDWTLTPHRKHLCASCGFIWKLANVPTVGVAEVRPPLVAPPEVWGPVIDVDT